MWLVISTLTALLAGLALLIAGLRRTPRGLAPHCRACDFSLDGHGTVPRPDLLCPECGKPITEPAHVIVGTRKRRPRLITAGGGILLLGLLFTTLMISIVTSKGAAVVPTIVLVPHTTLTDFSTPSAVAELNKRLTAGELSDSQKHSLIGGALDHQQKQGDVGREVSELLLGLLTSMTDEQTRRFVEQTMRVQLLTRPRIRQNAVLLAISDGRGLANLSNPVVTPPPLTTTFDCQLVEARLGDRVLKRGAFGREDPYWFAPTPLRLDRLSSFGNYYRFNLEPSTNEATPIPLGPTQLHQVWQFRARSPAGIVTQTWRVEHAEPITVVAPADNDVDPIKDAATRATLEAAFAKATLYNSHHGGQSFSLPNQQLPVDVAFSIKVFDAAGKPVEMIGREAVLTYGKQERAWNGFPWTRLGIPAATEGPLRIELHPLPPSHTDCILDRVWAGDPIILEGVKMPQ